MTSIALGVGLAKAGGATVVAAKTGTLGAATISAAKTGAAAGSWAGPIGAAIGAIVAVGGVYYLWSDSELVKAEETSDKEKTLIKATDPDLIEVLRSQEKCLGVSDVTQLIEMVQDLFQRRPDQKLYLENSFQQCLEGHKDPLKHKASQAAQSATSALAGVVSGAVGGAIHQRVHEFVKKERTNDDAALIHFLEKNDCSSIQDPSLLKREVEDLFRRRPVQKLVLQENFNKCMEQVRT